MSTLLGTPLQAWTDDWFLILCLNVLLGRNRFEPATKNVGMTNKYGNYNTDSTVYNLLNQCMDTYHAYTYNLYKTKSILAIYSHSWYWRNSRVVEVQWSFHQGHRTCYMFIWSWPSSKFRPSNCSNRCITSPTPVDLSGTCPGPRSGWSATIIAFRFCGPMWDPRSWQSLFFNWNQEGCRRQSAIGLVMMDQDTENIRS